MTETETTPLAVVTGASSGIGFELAKVFADTPVSAAALNAGVGQCGAFTDTDLADEIKIIDVNVTSTAHAPHNELKDTNITITSLMPGPTDTNFFHRAGMEDTHAGQAQKDDPAQVAQRGFDALMSGEGKIIAGSASTKVQGKVDKARGGAFPAGVPEDADKGTGREKGTGLPPGSVGKGQDTLQTPAT